MIPRFKPFFGSEELRAPFQQIPNPIAKFEEKFAQLFGTSRAIAFPYGRSALWSFFKALNIRDSEIILPAYTCSVVAHAIVLSGNIPKFVDINLQDFNMNLDQVEASITSQTRGIIATHLFGYPLDSYRLRDIVEKAENRFGQKIWVIQDCAHSFGAAKDGKSSVTQPDLALFGLNISKMFSSIFGGMLTTEDISLAGIIRDWRDNNYHQSGKTKTLRRWLYLLAVYPAFYEPLYELIYSLQFRTSLLNHFTRAYHLDDQIGFPPGFDEFMLPIEAKVGIIQLEKYPIILQKRLANVEYYHQHINPHDGWRMPSIVEGATYSHYVIQVPNRKIVLEAGARKGVQLGELIEYCIPELVSYRQYSDGKTFANASLCSKSTINLPIYPSLSEGYREKVVRVMNSIC